MQAYEFINNLIPPLKNTDISQKALTWMEEIRVCVLPVVDQGMFKGFVSDELIYTLNDPNLKISEIDLEMASCFVFSDKHIYDVLRVASDHQSHIVAVLDRDQTYRGVITMEDAVSAFAESFSIQSQGAVLVLSMMMSDYSMYEISRIIESENAKVLSSFISVDPLDDSKIKVTLKVDKSELRHIKATLERFGHRVIDHYQEEQESNTDQERIDNLFRFLDI
ncbi:CBS domain-containing protein [Belliella kenyensis]|uniref:CBS domain-containing protein n=1 Tax=Belliella kenyensis TaxID=1472724 RepID=A0ABV8EI85_9BACT|nr:CBS domain-containing protein [Belliella kenyensis]MCH7403683.1 CBS domain-containing protein [Belliella kenyensis]MDN3603450.1 CBS domain-containing protein [Belliella kenyensis]